jgi:integrase
MPIIDKQTKVPRYRRHTSGQARVTLNGKDHLLGPYDSEESREEYDRLIAKWLANKRQPPIDDAVKPGMTIAEMILRYWKYCQEYYGFNQLGPKRGDYYTIKDALRVLKKLYGSTQAKQFSPLDLKAVRHAMIERGWSRNYVNQQVARLKRVFSWSVEENLLPAGLPNALANVKGLRKGKTSARETPMVRPVDAATVQATLPYLPELMRALVDFQWLTGCRPAEACKLRPCDLDSSAHAKVWVYRPDGHKNEYRGLERLILLGPQAQDVIRPYLSETDADAYVCSPRRSENLRKEIRRAARKTKVPPSQMDRSKATPRRRPGERYEARAYARAIARACRQAFPPPGPLAKRSDETTKAWRARLSEDQTLEIRTWQREHSWHPNRLRHACATTLRPYGLDKVKTILGHSNVTTSEIYAEKDLAAAMELVAKIG